MTSSQYACTLTAWRDFQREIKAYLTHRVSDAALADDLVQNVFLQAMRQGRDFCTLDNPRAWLFQVARNAVADHYRGTRPHVPLPEDLVEEPQRTDPVDALTGCMSRVLDELASGDRDVIRNCDLQGVTLKTYADLNGLTLAAVKSRLLRARLRMRELMIRNCKVNFDDAGQVCCHVPRASAEGLPER